MRQVSFWQRKLLQEDDGHQRGYVLSLLAIWARNCSCLDCLLLCCINWTHRNHRKLTAKHSKRWDGPSGFLLYRKDYHTFYMIEKKETDELPRLSLLSFLLPRNVCWILWACALKMDAPIIQ